MMGYKLPEEFSFIHAESEDFYEAELCESGSCYNIYWNHGNGSGSAQYALNLVTEFVLDGTWIIVAYLADEKEEEEEEDEPVAYGYVRVSIQLENDTFLGEDEEVVILAQIEDNDFISGLGYVVFSEEHLESATIDSSLIYFIDKCDDIEVITFS